MNFFKSEMSGKKKKKGEITYVGHSAKNWREKAREITKKAEEDIKKNHKLFLEQQNRKNEAEANWSKRQQMFQQRFKERGNYFREQLQKKNLLPKGPIPNKKK